MYTEQSSEKLVLAVSEDLLLTARASRKGWLLSSMFMVEGKENHVGNLGERERKAELMAKDRGNMKCRKEKEQRKTQKT